VLRDSGLMGAGRGGEGSDAPPLSHLRCPRSPRERVVSEFGLGSATRLVSDGVHTLLSRLACGLSLVEPSFALRPSLR
jgi:hypothetical protein